jgi:putative flippase GtrA
MQTLLHRVLGPRLGALAVQFMRFGVVGAAGFMVDTAVVYALRGPIGIYAAGAAAYIFAASFSWLFNRIWAFRHAARRPAARQWAIFLMTQSVGFVVNRGVFALLVTISPLCIEHPVLATFAGTLAGMFINFGFARRYVFRP